MTLDGRVEILGFHGSPGTPREFSLLDPLLNNARISCSPRSSLVAAMEPKLVAAKVLLGFSWGAAEALLAAAEGAALPRALVLVAPYVFAPDVSILKRGLLRTPALGAALLRKMGPAQMRAFAEKSASPVAAPESFREYCASLAQPGILAQAVFEKHGKRRRIHDALVKLGTAKVPTLLVWGAEDQTSTRDGQIVPLLKALSIRQELCLEGAGHAIPWTHSGELSRSLDEFIEDIREEL